MQRQYLSIIVTALTLCYIFSSAIWTVSAQTIYPGGATLDTTMLQLPSYSKDECIVVHEGYVTSFDTLTLNPRWVAYELTADKLGDGAERSNAFKEDPCIRFKQATNKDYSHSGYDKGHMAPAADMKWSQRVMKESFYFTNISPQKPRLNRGCWKQLETKTRDMARRYGKVWIVMGPVIVDGYTSIGPRKVAVPQYFFKALLAFEGKQYHSAAFLFENIDGDQALKSVVMTVDQLEALVSRDFFKNLPPEDYLSESVVLLSDWDL